MPLLPKSSIPGHPLKSFWTIDFSCHLFPCYTGNPSFPYGEGWVSGTVLVTSLLSLNTEAFSSKDLQAWPLKLTLTVAIGAVFSFLSCLKIFHYTRGFSVSTHIDEPVSQSFRFGRGFYFNCIKSEKASWTLKRYSVLVLEFLSGYLCVYTRPQFKHF